MKAVQVCAVVLGLIFLSSFSLAWYVGFGQQSINSDYYFRSIYYSPTINYQQSPHWDYYSYNTFDPYPTIGGGLYFPRSGYSFTYNYPTYYSRPAIAPVARGCDAPSCYGSYANYDYSNNAYNDHAIAYNNLPNDYGYAYAGLQDNPGTEYGTTCGYYGC
jgi:hypothetical protein